MQNTVPSFSRTPRPSQERSTSPQLAINEFQLASRWAISVRTLRRWRQEQIGPVFLKLGSRVTYPLAEIESYERKVARYSTSVRVSP